MARTQSGRKAKPAAVKVAEGNPGGRPIPAQPSFDAMNVDPAPWLDPLAVTIWEKVVAAVRTDIFAAWDDDMLAGYCFHMACAIRAAGIIQAKGLTDENGSKRAEVTIYRDALHNARLIAAELGLTPAARAKGILPHEKEAKGDGWDF